MPDPLSYVRSLARQYLTKRARHRRISERTADRYLAVITRLTETLHAAELNITPTLVGEPELEYLLEYYRELDTDTQKWMLSIYNGYLLHYHNDTYQRMMVAWPSETRTNVDWLTPEEAVRMLDAAQGNERIIIHLELRLWLRRVEVLRLTSESIQELMDGSLEGVIHVHGKGRSGGKWRTIAWAPDTRAEIEYYQALRDEMIATARHYHETSWRTGKRARPREPFCEPESWVIYQRGKRVSGYSESGMDNVVARVAKRAGIARTVTNHTLRRTGARLAYFAGVPLVEIMEGLGHTSTRQTVRYLGLTVMELGKAQHKVHDYLQMIKTKMELRDGEAVVISEPTNQQKMRVSR